LNAQNKEKNLNSGKSVIHKKNELSDEEQAENNKSPGRPGTENFSFSEISTQEDKL
jgi:hypothetical protein